ncbi:MAG: chemotaxis protein CheW, partial [Oscillospiraceae bacterium]
TDVKDIKDGILILVEADDKSYCIFADHLLGEHQVVVKPIPVYLNKYNIKDYGIGGCSILGDGNITLILDMSSLGNNL